MGEKKCTGDTVSQASETLFLASERTNYKVWNGMAAVETTD